MSRKDSKSTFKTGHSNTDNQNNTVLLSTVVVSIRTREWQVNQDALLGSGSQASFIAANMAKVLELPTRRNQTTIITLGSTQTQKTCGILWTTYNDAVDVNLYLISKITNTTTSREIDKSQMRHINHFNLADPIFKTPSKVDVLLGDHVGDEIIRANRVKGNGLHLRDSITGRGVSGPVATSDANYITTFLAVSFEADTDQLLSGFGNQKAFPSKTT